jgi:hypothetical protein
MFSFGRGEINLKPSDLTNLAKYNRSHLANCCGALTKE